MSTHYCHVNWLVNNLIAEHSVNLIAGTSRTGKTALALPMLDQYSIGEGMLDYSPNPSLPPRRMGALVLDRSPASIQSEITRLECHNLSTPQTFPITDLDPEIMGAAFRRCEKGSEPNVFDLMCAVQAGLLGRPQLLYIEAIDDLMPPGPVTARVIRKFLVDLGKFCKRQDCTIIGTVGTAKHKAGEGYLAPIDQITGYSTWGSGTATAIIITYPDGPTFTVHDSRRLFIASRGVQDRIAYARFQREGRLELAVPVIREADSPRDKLSARLAAEPEGSDYTRGVFVEWGEQLTVSSRTVDKWIAEQIELGMLDKQGKTSNAKFRKPVTN